MKKFFFVFAIACFFSFCFFAQTEPEQDFGLNKADKTVFSQVETSPENPAEEKENLSAPLEESVPSEEAVEQKELEKAVEPGDSEEVEEPEELGEPEEEPKMEKKRPKKQDEGKNLPAG